jgi:hypothetical protein
MPVETAGQSKRESHNVCHKAAVWRAPDLKAGQDAEQGVDVSVHRLQYASGDQSSVIGDGFYKAIFLKSPLY